MIGTAKIYDVYRANLNKKLAAYPPRSPKTLVPLDPHFLQKPTS